MYDLKNKISDKKKQLGKLENVVNYDTIYDYVRILSPNIYKVFDKLNSNEQFSFVNNNNKTETDIILVGDTKNGISLFDVNNVLSNIKNKTEKDHKFKAYYGFGFLEWNEEGVFEQSHKLPIILMPISLVLENESYQISRNVDFEIPFVNPELKLLLQNSKEVNLPKFDFNDKIYNYLDKLQVLCEDNEINFIEEGGILALDLFDKKLYYNIEKVQEMLNTNKLLAHLYSDNNNNIEIFDYLNNIDINTKYQSVYDFATKPFYDEEVNPLILSSLDFSFIVNYDSFYLNEDLSNKCNFISNIVSSLVKNNRKVLYLGKEGDCEKIYKNFDENPLKSLILTLTDDEISNLKNTKYQNILHKNFYDVNTENNIINIEKNRNYILSYFKFLKEEFYPLKLPISSVVEKYFDLKNDYEEVFMHIDNVRDISMLDLHQYVHDINGFIKIYNEDSDIVENIWFSNNITDLSEKNIDDIAKRIDNLYIKGMDFYERFKTVSTFAKVEYETMGDFYKFCKEVSKIEVSKDFKVIDYDYEKLTAAIEEYNSIRKEVFDAKRQTFESYGNEIYKIEIEKIVNELDENFDNLYQEINNTLYDEDYIIENIDIVISTLESFSTEIKQSLDVCDSLFNMFDLKDNYSVTSYDKMSKAFKPLYKDVIYEKKWLNIIELEKVIFELNELIKLQEEINILNSSINKTFTNEFYNVNVNEFIEKIEYLESAGVSKILSFRYKKEREYVKSFLRFSSSLEDFDFLSKKVEEFLYLKNRISEFDSKVIYVNEFLHKNLKINSNLIVEKTTLDEIHHMLMYFKGEIPEKIYNVLTGEDERNVAMGEALRKLSIGFDKEILENIKALLLEQSHIKLFNISLERINIVFNSLIKSLNTIKDEYGIIQKYLIKPFKYLENINKLKAIIKINSQEKYCTEFYEEHLTPYKSFLDLKDNNLTKAKSETLVIEHGKQLGLSLKTIEKIMLMDRESEFENIYTNNIDTNFIAFSLEVKWLCNILGIDIQIQTFNQLKNLLEQSKESFDIVRENKELFEYLTNKTKVNIKNIIIALYNNEVKTKDYINTFYISFYKQWIMEVSKDYDFNFETLNETFLSIHKDMKVNGQYNSYKIYNEYCNELPLLDEDKKYYDEVDTFVKLKEENTPIREFFYSTPYLLQSYKPIVLSSFEKFIEMGKFKHINFDTIIVDSYDEKNISDALSYFTNVSQVIILNNKSKEEKENYELDIKNIPEFSLNNIFLNKKTIESELLRVVDDKEYLKVQGKTLYPVDVKYFERNFESKEENCKNIYEQLETLKLNSNQSILFTSLDIQQYFIENYDNIKCSINNVYDDFSLSNKEVFICLNTIKDVNIHNPKFDLEKIVKELSLCKKITLVINKDYFDVEKDFFFDSFNKVIKYLYNNSIENIYKVEKYALNYFNVNEKNTKFISDLEMDFYNFLDATNGFLNENVKYNYLWSYPLVVDKNYEQYLKNNYNKSLDVNVEVDKLTITPKESYKIFETYKEANLYDIEPSKNEEEFITNSVKYIVSVEAPINITLLYKKIEQALSGIYTTEEVAEKVNYTLQYNLNNYISIINGFCWTNDNKILKPRYRHFDCNIENICIEEVKLGMLEILNSSFGITIDNLFQYLLKEFGFTNIKNEHIEYIRNVYLELERENYLVKVGNKIIK